ncbi:MAG: VWA domain-containing protein [Pseudomonadota bacterium]
MIDQQPFGDGSEFIDNPEPRCPVVLLLDTSYSMSGAKIAALNDGLLQFHEEVASDSLAAKRIELSVVTFGPVTVLSDFGPVTAFEAPTLEPSGNTPMGEAIVRAAALTRARKDSYRTGGIDFYRPWLFLITDGAPTDDVTAAKKTIADGERDKAFMFFAVGVEGADMEALSALSVRAPLMLKGLQFKELFAWLSNSLSKVSQSRTDEAPALDNPAAPSGWAVAGE